MSRFHTRAAYFYAAREPDSNRKPTTLTETGDRSPQGFGYVNTGTRTPETPITLGGTDGNRWQQPGADDNTSQTAQAYAGFMNMRRSTLYTDLEHGRAAENRDARQQAKIRLKGEVF